MKTIDCSTVHIPFICAKLLVAPTMFAQCIVCMEDGEPIAGATYDCYTGVSITAHLWIAEGKVPSREWYAAIFDYPFNRLRVKKLGGQVPSTNLPSLRLNRHFGFVEEAVIKDWIQGGDLVIFTMTKEQCRVLNSPAWKRHVALVESVA